MLDSEGILLPKRLENRPRDKRGYLIPYAAFVDPRTKEPDFRIIDTIRTNRCMKFRLCGLCGREIGRVVVFIGGPLSVSNSLFHDPAMHEDCARYATKACPYLSRKNARHRPLKLKHEEDKLIEITHHPLASDSDKRPETMSLYFTTTYTAMRVPVEGHPDSSVIKAGKPLRIETF